MEYTDMHHTTIGKGQWMLCRMIQNSASVGSTACADSIPIAVRGVL